jgi:hypothetical protein
MLMASTLAGARLHLTKLAQQAEEMARVFKEDGAATQAAAARGDYRALISNSS